MLFTRHTIRLWPIAALALTLLGSPTAHPGPLTPDSIQSSGAIPESVDEANRLIQQGRPDQALQVLDRILWDHPEDRLTLYTRARLLARMGRLDDAQVIVDQLMRDDPPAALAVHLQGYLFSRRGEWGQALAHYKRAYLAGHDRYFMNTMAQAYINVEGPDATLEFLTDHLAAHPGEHNVRLMRAKLYQREKRYAAAAADYAALQAAVPDNPAVWKNAADMLLEQRNPRAVEYAREAVRLAPDIPQVQHTLGRALGVFGEPEESARVLAAAHDRDRRNAAIAYDYALALDRTGAEDRAREIMSALAVSESPWASAAARYLQSRDSLDSDPVHN